MCNGSVQPGLSFRSIVPLRVSPGKFIYGDKYCEIRDKIICVTMGTIYYSGELLCQLWDNSEVDFRGVLGACEWFTHHLTCMGTQNNNSNDGGKSRIFPYMCVNGSHIYSQEWEWDSQGWG